MADVELGTLYDMNKVAMAKLKPLHEHEKREKHTELKHYFQGKPYQVNGFPHYYMMLCREKNDYTLLHLQDNKSIPAAASEVILCLEDRGDILAIDRTEDRYGYELWIKRHDTNEICMYLLFPYDSGVIECDPLTCEKRF